VLAASSLLARVQAFDRGLRERAAPRRVTHDFGTAILCPGLPRVWDLNVAFLDVELERGDADSLIAEVEGLQSEAGLRHRRVLVGDEVTAERLLPRFVEREWTHSWWAFMVHEGSPCEAVDPNLAAEVDSDVVREVEGRALAEDDFVRDAGLVPQLLAGRDRLSAGTPARFFAGTRDGEPVSVCTLYSDGTVAQLEDVATLAEHRGHGCGRAVVQAALHAAQAAAHEVVFVVADDGDWPKMMYRRLGFEPIGRALNLVREPIRREQAPG
jgi:ribosomal protein S18 acetylase RimI-like enzyme